MKIGISQKFRLTIEPGLSYMLIMLMVKTMMISMTEIAAKSLDLAGTLWLERRTALKYLIQSGKL